MPNPANAQRINIRYCTRCGDRLRESNKSKDQRCENTRACLARAQVKYPQPPASVYTKKRDYLAEGLDFEKLVAALCVYYNYGDQQAGEMLSEGNVDKYLHARQLLIYLLVEDLRLTYAQVKEYLERHRRTISAAHVEVHENLGKYRADIAAIRQNYNLQKTEV